MWALRACAHGQRQKTGFLVDIHWQARIVIQSIWQHHGKKPYGDRESWFFLLTDAILPLQPQDSTEMASDLSLMRNVKEKEWAGWWWWWYFLFIPRWRRWGPLELILVHIGKRAGGYSLDWAGNWSTHRKHVNWKRKSLGPTRSPAQNHCVVSQCIMTFDSDFNLGSNYQITSSTSLGTNY